MVLHLPKEQCMAGITGLEAAAALISLSAVLRGCPRPRYICPASASCLKQTVSLGARGLYQGQIDDSRVHHVATLKPKRMDLV